MSHPIEEDNTLRIHFTLANKLSWAHSMPFDIREPIWEKGPIGNVFTNLIAEKLPFQMLQTILKYS